MAKIKNMLSSLPVEYRIGYIIRGYKISRFCPKKCIRGKKFRDSTASMILVVFVDTNINHFAGFLFCVFSLLAKFAKFNPRETYALYGSFKFLILIHNHTDSSDFIECIINI